MSSLPGIFTSHYEQDCFGSHGQYNSQGLRRQGSMCSSPMSGSSPPVGALHCSFHQLESILPTRNIEPAGRSPQHVFLLSPQVVSLTGHYEGHLPMVGGSPYRPVCHLQQECHQFCSLQGQSLGSLTMDKTPVLHIFFYPADSPGSEEEQARSFS